MNAFKGMLGVLPVLEPELRHDSEQHLCQTGMALALLFLACQMVDPPA